jgi:hypothetical protein
MKTSKISENIRRLMYFFGFIAVMGILFNGLYWIISNLAGLLGITISRSILEITPQSLPFLALTGIIMYWIYYKYFPKK